MSGQRRKTNLIKIISKHHRLQEQTLSAGPAREDKGDTRLEGGKREDKEKGGLIGEEEERG